MQDICVIRSKRQRSKRDWIKMMNCFQWIFFISIDRDIKAL